MLIAARWKELVYCWESNEWILMREIHSSYDPFRLRKRAWFILICFIVLEFLIQLFFRVSGYRKTIKCTHFHNRLEAFFNLAFPELFNIVIYNAALGFLAITVSIFGEFARTYADIFLICICLALREQFWILNNRIFRTPVNVSMVEEI